MSGPWLAIRPATPDEIDHLLTQTHPLWGAGRTLEAYRDGTRALLGSAWGRQQYRFMVGLDAAGAVVTACKRYRLALRLNGQGVTAVGFGAVFTPEPHRGRGHAAGLLRALAAEAAAGGARLALLFSDIGTGYYARLEYQPLGTQLAEAAAVAGPSPFVPLAGPIEPAWEHTLDGPLAFARAPDYREFLARRTPYEVWAYAPDGVSVGFAAVRATQGGLWVGELGLAAGEDPQGLYRGLRALAAGRGLSRVSGWLPRSAAAAGYRFSPLEQAVPMAASLTGEPLPPESQLWELDHF